MTDEQRSGWTGGQRAFGDFAPGMVYYTDKVLFGVRSRSESIAPGAAGSSSLPWAYACASSPSSPVGSARLSFHRSW